MKKMIALALALVMAICACTVYAVTKDEASQIASQVTDTTTDRSLVSTPFTEVIGKLQGSVVGVNNYQNYTYSSYNTPGFGGFGGWGGYGGYGNRSTETVERLAATGSGVVVYDGLVLTNYHVVEDATRLTISVLGDENEYEGTLVSYDEAKDIAVIYAPKLQVSPVPLGDSDQLQVGEWAIIIGNPLMDELKGTVTVGIVSALDREISSTSSTDKYGLKTKSKNVMIQTDAAINNGNSGGGLFNVLGQLMGIPSLKYSGQSSSNSAMIEGIGMAIPVNTAKPIIQEAIVKVLTGEVVKADDVSGTDSSATAKSGDKPMLGVTGSAINTQNSYYVYMGLLPGGMLIDEVSENSPAAAAGIQPYDVIVEVDGQIASSVTVIRNALDAHAYGDIIKVKVYRCEGLKDAQSATDVGEGEYIDFDVTLFEFNTKA
ncbi:MAG: trypsin-like peptidase domain-containing protein [Clostridia bacterium]|jgi:serine protease Do|nr:trypsin-like peptidase domain-containing protein [Clostridia bacterium]MBR5379289.1 trypsin-like peptidase domain-containing protein [Clostridia bacterium]